MKHFKQTLQNPVWHALGETQKDFSINYEGVKFYHPEICPFGAFEKPLKTETALTAYSKLTDSFFLVSENGIPTYSSNSVILNQKIEGCQMVLNQLNATQITEVISPLNFSHINEIYNLIWLVMPGYYKRKTFEMGDYFGIFKDDKLVATAGQRMQTNDFIELSGVVTHPDYTRKGFAKQLITHATKEILKTGKQAILHTTVGNPAIDLYEGLGYKLTRRMNWWHFSSK